MILKSVITEEFKELTLDDIYDQLPSSEGDSAFIDTTSQEFGGFESKSTLRDIIFKYDVSITQKLNQPSYLNINIELERAIQSGYDLVNRATVYACQNLLATTKSIDGNVASYDDINKTYSIWICMKNHISKDMDLGTIISPSQFIHKYCMARLTEPTPVSFTYDKRADLINLIFIELGDIIDCLNNGGFQSTDGYDQLVEFLPRFFTKSDRSTLDENLIDLSKLYPNHPLKEGDDRAMTSRILSMSQLEEKAINEEIENLILVLTIKQTPLEEITQQVKSKYSLTEDVIKTILNRIQLKLANPS